MIYLCPLCCRQMRPEQRRDSIVRKPAAVRRMEKNGRKNTRSDPEQLCRACQTSLTAVPVKICGLQDNCVDFELTFMQFVLESGGGKEAAANTLDYPKCWENMSRGSCMPRKGKECSV